MSKKQYGIGDIVWGYDPMWGILPYKITGIAFQLSCGDGNGGCTSEICVDVNGAGTEFWETKEEANNAIYK